MKKLSKKAITEILKKVLGDWQYVELSEEEADSIWEKLKDRKPYYSTSSLHLMEDRYRLNKKIYSAFFDSGSCEKPSWISVREKIDWSKK